MTIINLQTTPIQTLRENRLRVLKSASESRRGPRKRIGREAYMRDYAVRTRTPERAEEAIVRTRLWREANPCEYRRYQFIYNLRNRRYQFIYNLRTYNLTIEEWDSMLIAQCGRCGSCGDPMIGSKEPAIDHDHATGCVRGLLCCACNGGLGFFRDEIARMEKAIAYLRENG